MLRSSASSALIPYLTLHHPARAEEYYARGLWQCDTFYSLTAQHAAARPDAIALQDDRRALTWMQLREMVDGIGSALRSAGLVTGDRVSMCLSNRIEGVATFLACSREGFACNPSLHQTYTIAEICELIGQLSAAALITEPNWGANHGPVDVTRLRASSSSLKAVYTPESVPHSVSSSSPAAADPDKVVYLAFTSGTTGRPKCVMHSDNTLLANARDLVRDWEHGDDTVMLTLSPLTHHIAWVAAAQWLVAGGRLVLTDATGGERIDRIVSSGATYVLGVPTHAIDLLAALRTRGLEQLGRVKVFYMAGSSIPPNVADAFVTIGIKPQNIYGMTENSSHQYTHPSDDIDTIVTTCGRGGPAYEVRIFDQADHDRVVEPGVAGEIGGRGAALMLGYFDNQAATTSSFNRDGWFLSGDLGVLDARGNLRVVGRLKDMINRGGRNIYPAHIEALAMRHAAVSKAACIPVPDPRLGERVCIAVCGTVRPDDLLAYLAAEGLSKYDMPEYFVRVVQFPLTASGKILKRELVEMVKRGELQPTGLS